MKTQDEQVKHEISKKIKETELKIEALALSINGLEKIKHFKAVDKKMEKAGTTNKAHLAFEKGKDWSSSDTINIYLNDRIYSYSEPDKNGVSTADYFNDYQEQFSINKLSTYQDIINAIKSRIEGLTEAKKKLTGELKNIDALIIEAQKIDDRAEDFKNNLSYTTSKAISSHCFIKFI